MNRSPHGVVVLRKSCGVRVASKHELPKKDVPKRKSPRNLGRAALIVLLASVFSTLIIHASDALKTPHSTQLAAVGTQNVSRCPSEMMHVTGEGDGFCIDRFEASAGEFCVHKDPLNQFETINNLIQTQCAPESKPDSRPWVNISLTLAQEVCSRAGKRLPSNGEWYRAALGTPDTVSKDKKQCALGRAGQARADNTGSHDACVSSYGTYDMVGNVWEWVDGEIRGGVYKGETLPAEGYVDVVDVDGVPLMTTITPEETRHRDYFFAANTGVRAMFRGGYWSMEEKAGVTSLNATIPTSFVGVAVGFRCAK